MRARFLALLLVLLPLAGCAEAMQVLDDMTRQAPTAKVDGVGLSGLSLQSVVLDFDIAIANPYSFDLPLLGFDFGLATGGQAFLNGDLESSWSIPARGSRVVQLPLSVDLLGLVRTVSGLRPGNVVPYDAEIGLKLDVPGAGPMRIPVRTSGEMPIPDVPRVSVASLDWSEVSLNRVGGDLKLAMTNPNDFPLTLKGLDYGFSLAGRDVANGSNEAGVDLASGGEGALTIPLGFSPREVGTAILNVLTGSSAEYGMQGNLTLDSPFGPMQLPFTSQGVAPLTR